jgi:hypothetical protein
MKAASDETEKDEILCVKENVKALKKEIEELRSNQEDINNPVNEFIQLNGINTTIRKLQNENQRLRNELIRYKVKRNEYFYQVIVENWLNGTHFTNNVGITDVTNETTHAEIKEWNSWKSALGQLLAYQTDVPKEHLYVCLFGTYRQSNKEHALDVFNKHNIKCFEFEEEGDMVYVKNVISKNRVFEYNFVCK